MLYNEEEVLRICKKYGIETEVMEGYPTYMGKEMNENFSIEEIMREPIPFANNSIICTSGIVKLSLPVFVENTFLPYTEHLSTGKGTLVYKKESGEEDIVSSIPYNNENKFAA